MDVMKWIALVAALVGCQNGSATADKPAVTPAYKQDIENLCDVLHRSGADQLPAGDRAPSIAMWLGPNIKTDAGHAFLISIQPLAGEPKAKALETEAARVGLDGCALAAEWRH
jgi:hypothetical protein